MGLFLGKRYQLILLIIIVHNYAFVEPPFSQSDQQGYTHGMVVNNFVKEHGDRIGRIQRRDLISDQHEHKIEKNPCELEGSCERNQEPRIIPVCYCDDLCHIYNDCCHDNSFLIKNETIFSVERIKYMSCITDTLKTRLSYIFGVFMVSKCPLSAEHHYPKISELCRTEEVFPVTSENGIVFKNIHCAYCHGVSNYSIWTVAFYYAGIDCTVEKISQSNRTYLEKFKYIRKHCSSWFLPPNSTMLRFCVKSKSVNYLTAENNLCSEFQNPVLFRNSGTVNNIKYDRNIHCNEDQLAEDIITCLRQYPYVTEDGKVHGSVSLKGLFSTRHYQSGSGDECQIDEMKQSMSMECGDCGSLSQKLCVEELIQNYKYRLELAFISNNVSDLSTVYRVLSFFYLSLPIQKYGVYLNLQAGHISCTENLLEPCCALKGFISFTINKAKTFQQISSFIKDVSNMDCTFKEKHVDKYLTFSKIEDVSLHCPTLQLPFLEPVSERDLDQIMKIFQRSKPSGDYVPIYVNGTISVIDSINSDFVVEKWRVTYKHSTNTSFINNSETTGTQQTEWGTKSILTYLTLGLSCLFLLIAMSFYCYLGLFQSSAGKISGHMMLSLFCAQLFFITATGANFIYEVCFVIAVLSHYLWLCTFSWMSVFCIQVLQQIGKIKKKPGSILNKDRLSFRHIFGGYILPAGFVLPCVLLDIFTDISIEYTGDICFISGYPANLIAFTVPVLVSILTNITALITTSILISRYNNTIKSLQTVTITRSFIPLYFRSCVLCAFPWSFGILADIFDSDILDYFYIVLAGLHGAFVSVSFMSTKTVTNKVQKMFRKRIENTQGTELNQIT